MPLTCGCRRQISVVLTQNVTEIITQMFQRFNFSIIFVKQCTRWWLYLITEDIAQTKLLPLKLEWATLPGAPGGPTSPISPIPLSPFSPFGPRVPTGKESYILATWQHHRHGAMSERLTWGSLGSWSALSAHLPGVARRTWGSGITRSTVFPWGPGATWGCHLYWRLHARHIVRHSLWGGETCKGNIFSGVRAVASQRTKLLLFFRERYKSGDKTLLW